jgi:Tfp pilus assembly protein PilE
MKHRHHRDSRSLLQNKGVTLMEVLLVAGLIGVLALVVVQFFQPMFKFFQGSQARAQANREARICMDTIQLVLSAGRATTLQVSTPSTTPAVPLSQAQFTGLDKASYVIAWSTAPMNTVHLQKTPPGGGTGTDTILATNVTGLHFGIDTRDPGVVSVTLHMTVPLNTSGAPDSFYQILLPNQIILMDAS